ncbi:MAG: hypothetical protein R6U35_06025, partial [Candidatus Humimicrobiaceae bacterium]
TFESLKEKYKHRSEILIKREIREIGAQMKKNDNIKKLMAMLFGITTEKTSNILKKRKKKKKVKPKPWATEETGLQTTKGQKR